MNNSPALQKCHVLLPLVDEIKYFYSCQNNKVSNNKTQIEILLTGWADSVNEYKNLPSGIGFITSTLRWLGHRTNSIPYNVVIQFTGNVPCSIACV